MTYKILKITPELYAYIRYTGEKRYGKSLSTNYLIYLAFKELNTKR